MEVRISEATETILVIVLSVAITFTKPKSKKRRRLKMPNWCENDLLVIGRPSSLAKFKKKAKTRSSALSLQKLIPIPEELQDTQSPPRIVPDKDIRKAIIEHKARNSLYRSGRPISASESEELIKKYGANNWYDWQVLNWGTKWDIEAILNNEEEGKLGFTFNSAWSPPIQAFQTISRQFPELDFKLKYSETGMGFYGNAKFKRGQVDDEVHDYTEEDYKKMEEDFGL